MQAVLIERINQQFAAFHISVKSSLQAFSIPSQCMTFGMRVPHHISPYKQAPKASSTSLSMVWTPPCCCHTICLTRYPSLFFPLKIGKPKGSVCVHAHVVVCQWEGMGPQGSTSSDFCPACWME